MSQAIPISQNYLPECFANSLAPEYTRAELAEQVDWDDWVPRLIGYARWRQSRHGALVARCALQPTDCAQEAVKLWLDGTRTFERGTERELFSFFCSVIDSLISHDLEKTFRRGSQVSIRKDGGDDAGAGEIAEGRIRSKDDFEHKLVFREELKGFLRSLGPELARYARFRVNELDFSAEQRAMALGISVADIRNLDRRLKRWGTQWWSQDAAMPESERD
jgi:hypothetical protein